MITRRAFLANGTAVILTLATRKPRRSKNGAGFGLAPFSTAPFGG